MRVNAASLDIRDATTSTPGTLNDLTTDLIMANNNNNMSLQILLFYCGRGKWIYYHYANTLVRVSGGGDVQFYSLESGILCGLLTDSVPTISKIIIVQAL